MTLDFGGSDNDFLDVPRTTLLYNLEGEVTNGTIQGEIRIYSPEGKTIVALASDIDNLLAKTQDTGTYEAFLKFLQETGNKEDYEDGLHRKNPFARDINLIPDEALAAAVAELYNRATGHEPENIIEIPVTNFTQEAQQQLVTEVLPLEQSTLIDVSEQPENLQEDKIPVSDVIEASNAVKMNSESEASDGNDSHSTEQDDFAHTWNFKDSLAPEEIYSDTARRILDFIREEGANNANSIFNALAINNGVETLTRGELNSAIQTLVDYDELVQLRPGTGAVTFELSERFDQHLTSIIRNAEAPLTLGEIQEQNDYVENLEMRLRRLVNNGVLTWEEQSNTFSVSSTVITQATSKTIENRFKVIYPEAETNFLNILEGVAAIEDSDASFDAYLDALSRENEIRQSMSLPELSPVSSEQWEAIRTDDIILAESVEPHIANEVRDIERIELQTTQIEKNKFQEENSRSGESMTSPDIKIPSETPESPEQRVQEPFEQDEQLLDINTRERAYFESVIHTALPDIDSKTANTLIEAAQIINLDDSYDKYLTLLNDRFKSGSFTPIRITGNETADNGYYLELSKASNTDNNSVINISLKNDDTNENLQVMQLSADVFDVFTASRNDMNRNSRISDPIGGFRDQIYLNLVKIAESGLTDSNGNNIKCRFEGSNNFEIGRGHEFGNYGSLLGTPLMTFSYFAFYGVLKEACKEAVGHIPFDKSTWDEIRTAGHNHDLSVPFSVREAVVASFPEITNEFRIRDIERATLIVDPQESYRAFLHELNNIGRHVSLRTRRLTEQRNGYYLVL